MQGGITPQPAQSAPPKTPLENTQQLKGTPWNQLEYWFNKENLTLTAAGIALCGVIASALISSLFSQRSLYLNAVTQERSKWIGNLRSNLAIFIAKFRSVREKIHDDSPGDKDFDNAVDELIELRSILILQLNPDNDVDNNIISLLDSAANTLVHEDVRHAEEAEKLLSRHAQWLLKNEWEKVKHEARLMKFPFSWKIREYFRSQRYKKFCTENDIDKHVRSVYLSDQEVDKIRNG